MKKGKIGTLLTGLGVTATFVFGLIGFSQVIEEEQALPFLTVVYRTFQLFSFSSYVDKPWPNIWLEMARWLGPVSLMAVAIKSTLFLFRERVALFRISKLRNHIVVCGIGSIGRTLVESIIENRKKIVIIESDPNNKSVGEYRQKNIPVIIGNAADCDVLRSAGSYRAKEVFAMTGDDMVNLEVAKHLDEKGLSVRCFASFSDFSLYSFMSGCPPFDHIVEDNPAMNDSRLFNISIAGARRLMSNSSPDQYFNRDELLDSGALIAGFGEFGHALTMQLARIAIYDEKNNFSITVLEDIKNDFSIDFTQRYRDLEKFTDIEFKRTKLDRLGESNLEKLIEQRKVRIAFICLESDSDTIEFLERTAPFFIKRNVKVITAIWPTSGLGNILPIRAEKLGSPEFFTIVENTCRYDEICNTELDLYARTIHENYLNEKKKRLQNNPEKMKSVKHKAGANEQPWDRLQEVYRESNRAQADHNLVKLRLMGLDVSKDPDTTKIREFKPSKADFELLGRIEHKRWCVQQILAGWKFKQCEKDEKLRTHPDICPFDDLTEEKQGYDYQAVEKIPEVIKAAGYTIVKRD